MFSYQIYDYLHLLFTYLQERYTCPSLKVHPSDSSFIAQTNGNYIAAFSTNRPYKMKDKRYTGHKVRLISK